jgi:hypothetical protein
MNKQSHHYFVSWTQNLTVTIFNSLIIHNFCNLNMIRKKNFNNNNNNELGRRLTIATDDPRETMFLFQRISIAIQRFNAVCFAGSFVGQLDYD